jgi:hypothetical protein
MSFKLTFQGNAAGFRDAMIEEIERRIATPIDGLLRPGIHTAKNAAWKQGYVNGLEDLRDMLKTIETMP